MKRFTTMLIIMCMLMSLTACNTCDHDWYLADCMSPKTCGICGATEGEIGDHVWANATCAKPAHEE